jgi:predicted  nucleic acid-binding Zn-ribbon protein
MTTIGTSPYVTGYANTGVAANKTTTTLTADTSAQAKAANNATAAVNVTLSAEAQAALKAQTDTRSADGVVSEARSAIDALLKAAKAPSALKDGKATIDLSDLDRRELYAVASNRGGKFPIEQQVVATLELKSRQSEALAGPAASARITGDYASLYQAALDRLDAAGPEEKATGQWAKDRAAVVEGRKQAIAKPGVAPTDIEGDPVAAYLKEIGGVVANPRTRDFGKVASDVRAVLDKQYATATADGAATDADSGDIDFSKFDDRSLAAVSLNRDGQFSDHEVRQALSEIRVRDHQSVMASYKDSDSSDPSNFGKSMITRYAAMTSEEREASGWTPELYDKMVAMQNTREKLASMFSASGGLATTGAMTLLDYLS